MKSYWENEHGELYVGESSDVLKSLDEDSIDCVVTSPPYFHLRDYESGKGEIGQEDSKEKFITGLMTVFEQVHRVLKDTGTVFVNLGDSYVDGDLGLIPYRFAIAMQGQGFIVRNIINWVKPNARPESSKNRYGVDFENFIFCTKKKTGYYFDTQFEPSGDMNKKIKKRAKPLVSIGEQVALARIEAEQKKQKSHVVRQYIPNPEGRRKRTTWFIPIEPHNGHHATYPEELIETPISSGCPKGGVVLDPFMGSGTTAKVAERLGRRWKGIELNEEYAKLSIKKINKTFNTK